MNVEHLLILLLLTCGWYAVEVESVRGDGLLDDDELADKFNQIMAEFDADTKKFAEEQDKRLTEMESHDNDTDDNYAALQRLCLNLDPNQLRYMREYYRRHPVTESQAYKNQIRILEFMQRNAHASEEKMCAEAQDLINSMDPRYMSPGTIVGIVLGVLLAVGCVGGVLAFMWYRRRSALPFSLISE